MGFLDGEIAELVGTNLVDAGLSLPVTLVSVTPTVRIPGAVTRGTDPTTTTHSAQGFVASLESFRIRDALIKGVSRVVKLYASTIIPVVVPKPGDKVTISGLTSEIAGNEGGRMAVTTDAAVAVWTLQCL